MTDTELRRQEIIDELQADVTDDLIEILHAVHNMNYYDNCYDNTIDSSLVWNCDHITRCLDSYRKKLDELNGKTDGMYPWA